MGNNRAPSQAEAEDVCKNKGKEGRREGGERGREGREKGRGSGRKCGRIIKNVAITQRSKAVIRARTCLSEAGSKSRVKELGVGVKELGVERNS